MRFVIVVPASDRFDFKFEKAVGSAGLNVAISELALLTVTNTASDADLPANNLVYSLVSPPGGAHISSSGLITWTPDESQGPGVYTLTTVVTDDGSPAMSATNRFQVTVKEVNTAPVLPVARRGRVKRPIW